ncbi:hypothetical protein Sango_0321600 [Sesamum angolense]|uniref:Translocation protein SEC62 n=1 Tax=Sesamum angolense TaxID=2727404 RepID=A0AAE2C377_9LAMI|nr:hypothetical protein Sango_0321600 [Sesamum angolense]
MKKAGGGGGGAAADKKRGRRSYAESATDAPTRNQAVKKDVFQIFAEKVRDHKDLESRWAVLQETRVEYFRGKDFVSFLRNHAELKDLLESDKKEATLKELFQFWPKKDEGERPKWTARLFYAIVAVLVILLLRHHAPDEAARARYQQRVSNIIDDVLEWSPRLALSGMMEKQTGVNVTDSKNNVTDGSKAGAETVAEPEDTEGETIPDQFEEEETQNLGHTDHRY